MKELDPADAYLGEFVASMFGWEVTYEDGKDKIIQEKGCLEGTSFEASLSLIEQYVKEYYERTGYEVKSFKVYTQTFVAVFRSDFEKVQVTCTIKDRYKFTFEVRTIA